MAYASVFEGKTKQDFIDYLHSGTGINVDTFDHESLKTLEDFYVEVAGYDVTVTKDTEGRIYRHANSVKTLVTVPSREMHLLEVKREYLRKSVTIPGIKGWTVSETRKRYERPYAAAIRGVKEELGLVIKPVELVYDPLMDEVTTHRSSVYTGVTSIVALQRVQLNLQQILWEDGKVITDGDVLIHTKWFSSR